VSEKGVAAAGGRKDCGAIASRRVYARSLVRKMRGGAQAHLVRTDKGWYVVKWKQNPQHRRVLINEVIGAELLRRLGIATPDWAMVHADPGFLDAHPAAGIHFKDRFVPAEPGWHFGSKVPLNPEKAAIHDFLPFRLLPRVSNLNDFQSVFVFDEWVDNCDGRQAIFFGISKKLFSAQMIDNGYVFGFDGSEWQMGARPGARRRLSSCDVDFPPGPSEQFESIIVDIQAVAGTEFDSIRKAIPPEWIDDDMDAIARLFDELGRRAKRLPDLMVAARANRLQRLARYAVLQSAHGRIA
jgi:hypothetical protein